MHTKYQPPFEEWACPKCGASVEGGFLIEETGICPDDDNACELLHSDDEVRCYTCGYTANGARVASLLLKKNSMVKCSCCNGSGYVKGSK